MGSKSLNEIIFYQTDQLSEHIEVRVKNDTVWLNRRQLADLYDRDVKTIGKHINNILQEELRDISVVANFATTAKDGKTYHVEYYSLDMVISLGYRVKSQRGIGFRIWANKILKDHMFRGYTLSRRIDRIENNVDTLKEELRGIEIKLKTADLPQQGIFFDGQVFDAFIFVTDLIKSANHSIILIDNYVDEQVLTLLSKKKKPVRVLIYTHRVSGHLELAIKHFNEQFPSLKIKPFKRSHDRFLIIDKKEIYHIGASLKDLGKKWFAFSKLHINPDIILNEIQLVR